MKRRLLSLSLAAGVAIWSWWVLAASQPGMHPHLVITAQDVIKMREAIEREGRFAVAYRTRKAKVDAQITQPMSVPVPQDAGGGFTHERHKKNYQLMFDAGLVYQLSQEARYARFVRDMLLAYAELYPTLDVHPKRKPKSQNPGKLFWQSLNEAVWLVHTIQAYDLIAEALLPEDRAKIETQLLRPVALFLSEGQPSTFNKVHNHGTWATAGVGMAGYVLNEPQWVEQALYDLQLSGKGGFLRQLDTLFSPQGYYNEGPYYQRYALMPFVTFAKAIEHNEPERDIFGYRDGVLLKAIDTTIQLSYNGLFFPINDAIKSKGIDTIELVHGVTVAYGLTASPGYLDIASQQGQIVLSGDGLKVAEALDDGLAKPYAFRSKAFGDGADGEQGALVIMRSQQADDPAVLFKPAAQGLGHGHFDKLTWQFYHRGEEIVSDYGAARFLNVEAKFGGRYLPENTSYAKQSVAHNTVVVDETSHFDGKVKVGNQHAPQLQFFASNRAGTVAQANISTAYEDVLLERTLALVDMPGTDKTLVVDVFDVEAKNAHQFDLPLHYQGQLIDTSFSRMGQTQSLNALGKENGYQHLWLKGQGTPEKGLAQVTWLNDNGRFYTQTVATGGDESFLFTQLGANDPNFNLRNEHGFIRRVQSKRSHRFVSLLEPHGEYNPGKEFTRDAQSAVSDLAVTSQGDLMLIKVRLSEQDFVIAVQTGQSIPEGVNRAFEFEDQSFSMEGRLAAYALLGHQE